MNTLIYSSIKSVNRSVSYQDQPVSKPVIQSVIHSISQPPSHTCQSFHQSACQAQIHFVTSIKVSQYINHSSRSFREWIKQYFVCSIFPNYCLIKSSALHFLRFGPTNDRGTFSIDHHLTSQSENVTHSEG